MTEDVDVQYDDDIDSWFHEIYELERINDNVFVWKQLSFVQDKIVWNKQFVNKHLIVGSYSAISGDWWRQIISHTLTEQQVGNWMLNIFWRYRII